MVAGVVLLALGTAGCSAIAVTKPRSTPTGVVCHASYVPPVIDTAIAAGGAALLVWGATAPGNDGEYDHAKTGRDFAAVPGVLIGLTFAVAAIYGFTSVSSCKQAARGEARLTSSEK